MTRLSPGDKFQFSATFINALQEMVLAYKDGRLGVTGGGVPAKSTAPANYVLAFREEFETDLGEFCPVILRQTDNADPVPGIDPTDNTLEYQRRTVIGAYTPVMGDEGEAIGITLEPIAANSIGKVAVAGVVLATVDVTDNGHEFATLTDSETVLASATTGPARILWRETNTTGEQLCWILLGTGAAGAAGPPGSSAPTVYPHTNLGGSPNTFTVRQVHRNGSGSLVDDTGPVEYTAYEAQGRAVRLDTAGTPTQELPLFLDSDGKYWFAIDQFADGDAGQALAGLVSTAPQAFEGEKRFRQNAIANSARAMPTSPTPTPALRSMTNTGGSADYALTVYAQSEGTPFVSGAAVGAEDAGDFTGNYPLVVDGWVYTYQVLAFSDTTGLNAGAISVGRVDTGITTLGAVMGSVTVSFNGNGDAFAYRRHAVDGSGGSLRFIINSQTATGVYGAQYGFNTAGGIEKLGIYQTGLVVPDATTPGGYYEIEVGAGLWVGLNRVTPGAGGGAGGGGTPLSPPIPPGGGGGVVLLPPPPPGGGSTVPGDGGEGGIGGPTEGGGDG